MKAKKKQLLHMALLTAAVLLILAGYELYEKQQKANPDTGKGFIVIAQYGNWKWKWNG